MSNRATLWVFLAASCFLASGGAVIAAAPTRLDAQAEQQARLAITRGLEFLKNTQLPEGGWPAFQGGDPAITALAVKCFAQHPDFGPKEENVERAFDFIARFKQADGGIYVPDSGLNNYYTSAAVMALAHATADRHKALLADAQQYLIKLQYDEDESFDHKDTFYGGAGYANKKRPDLSNTQMMLEALHESGLSPEHPVYQRALVFISRCQMSPETNDQKFAAGGDGGFIYTCVGGGESKAGHETIKGRSVLRSYGSMTYSGFKSLLYARLSHDDPRVKQAIGWARSHYTLDGNPNMPGKQAKEGLYYFYHVFAKAMAAWGEDRITDASGVQHDWRKELIERLAAQQRSDGSWVNTADRWWESNPYLVTSYAVLALEETLK